MHKTTQTYKYYFDGQTSSEIKRTKNKGDGQKFWKNGLPSGFLFPKGLPTNSTIIIE